MRVFLTGATGFLGGRIARRLRARGDDVATLVRNPRRAGALEDLDCELVVGSLQDRARLRDAIADSDAVVHAAAAFEVGIPVADRPRLFAANVTGTRNVLESAVGAKLSKLVYVSTVAVYGNTRGAVADETS